MFYSKLQVQVNFKRLSKFDDEISHKISTYRGYKKNYIRDAIIQGNYIEKYKT